MDNNNSLCNSKSKESKFSKNNYNPILNADETLKTSVYSDYGQDWLVKETRTFQELGENSLKLRYLEKSLKSKRRIEQSNVEKLPVEEDTNERYQIDRNAIISKPFPFKADEFKYPNECKDMPQTVYVKYSDEFGKKKPIDMELPHKYHPINNEFSRGFTSQYKNHSLNTAPSKSKVHSSLDSVV